MLKILSEIDRYLFLKINQSCRNDFFDGLMPFLREAKIWVPLYLFLFVFSLINFGKKAWIWCLYLIVTVAASDAISSKIIKPFFARPRPCMDESFKDQVHLLASYCGGNGSFTSSHAANHFGIAMFIFISFRHLAGNFSGIFFIWAAVICFAQIYVGVHYPGDILGGAILGMLIGFATGKVYNNRNGLLVIT